MLQGQLTEQVKLVCGCPPQNITGAGFTSTWVSFANFRKARIALFTGAWAGGTSAVTLNQAKDNAGTGSKALAFSVYYTCAYGSTGGTTDALTKQTATSNTFNLSAANTLYLIELNAYDLDVSNNFLWMEVVAATPGSNNDYLAIAIDLYQPGISAKYSDVPSVLS